MALSSDGREWLLPTLFDASLFLTLQSRFERLFFRLGGGRLRRGGTRNRYSAGSRTIGSAANCCFTTAIGLFGWLVQLA